MGKNRQINTKIWEDEKVIENFTMEDKMFWLYLLTNKNSNNLGSYRLSKGVIARETGFHTDTITNILKRFINYHKLIDYDFDTSEILIINWNKYNWTTSPTFKKSIENQYIEIKSERLKRSIKEIIAIFYGDKKKVIKKDTQVKTQDNKEFEKIKQVIDGYNEIMETRLTYKNKATNSLIRARLSENYEPSELIRVVEYKKTEWKGTDYYRHVVPNTLFSNKHFANYLLQSQMSKPKNKKKQDKDNDKLMREMIAKKRKKMGMDGNDI